MNYEEMTDEQLDAELAKKQATSVAKKYEEMTDAELDAALELKQSQAQQSQSQQDTASGIRAIGGMALGGLQKAATAYDIYGGGASTRSGLMALMEGKNPFTAAYDQYGKEGAPTGEQIVEASPLRTPQFIKDVATKQTYQPSYGGYGAIPAFNKGEGAAIEVAADPAQAIPFIGGAKLAGKGGVASLGMVAKTAAKASDVVTGTKVAGTLADVTGKVLKNTSDYLMSMAKPKVKVNASELLDIAKKHNIPTENLPDTIVFDKNSVIARAQKSKASSPTGEADLQKFIDSRKSTTDALDTVIHGEATDGATQSAGEIGAKLRDNYNKVEKQTLNNVDFTYRTTADQMGEIPLLPESKARITKTINKFEKDLLETVQGGSSKETIAEANELLFAIKRLKASTGNVKLFAKRIHEIGQTAFKSKVAGTEYRRTMGILPEIYDSAKESFIETTRKTLGEDIASSLIENNKTISEFLNKSKRVKKAIDSSQSDEVIFQRLVKDAKSKDIEDLVSLLPESRNDIKSGLIESLIKRDSDGAITNWADLREQFGKKKVDVMKGLLNPDEAKSISELVGFGESIGPIPSNAPSQGQSGAWRNIVESVSDSILNDAVIQTMKNKAYKGSGIQRLVDIADKGTLNSKKGIKALSEISEEAQQEIRKALPGFNTRKAGLRGIETTNKDKKK